MLVCFTGKWPRSTVKGKISRIAVDEPLSAKSGKGGSRRSYIHMKLRAVGIRFRDECSIPEPCCGIRRDEKRLHAKCLGAAEGVLACVRKPDDEDIIAIWNRFHDDDGRMTPV